MNYIVLIIIILFFIVYLNSLNTNEYFYVDTHFFKIYKIFKTPEEIKNGLMFKKEALPENSAALFVFKEPRNVSFWMKNTYIPLDLIYLNSDYRVIKLYSNTKPLSLKGHHGKYVKYALECNSGTIISKNIKINDKIILT